MALQGKQNKLMALLLALALAAALKANVAGGGTGTGANVTVTDKGGTVVLSNGIVSYTITKSNAQIHAFSFNGTDYLAGGDGGGGGYFYWDFANPAQTSPWGSYTLSVDPASNGGDLAEVWIHGAWDGVTTEAAVDSDAYFDLPRGAQGIYNTWVLTHQASYPDYGGGEIRSNMYVGGIFDFICVDPFRYRRMASPSDTSVAVAGAPKEVYQFTSGIYNGSTGCKYSYTAELGKTSCYGWASTTTPNGVWQVIPSHEFYNGGPMKRELTAHLGNTLLNMFGGQHSGMGGSGDMPAGSLVTKTYGPAFIYANRYAGAATDISTVSQALWADAQAQAAAEQAAWPYTWFQHSSYAQASGRCTVSGTFAINDAYNPAASPAGMWIGLAPNDGVDFQLQDMTYQFWAKTAADGSFSIPNVLPGTYNLWAFGPGAAGTYQDPAVVTVAPGTLSLGTLTWAPPRLGPTVWEIGIPDRDSDEFNGGSHDVIAYSGVLPPLAGGAPDDTPAIWGAFLNYPNLYPNGVSYTVGVSDYSKDWNYCQPTVYNASAGTWSGSASTIYFNLAQAPTAGSKSRLYVAFAAGIQAACIVTINGTAYTGAVVTSTDGSNAATVANSANGFYIPNSADSMYRLGSNGDWGDATIDFPSADLRAGMNSISLGLRPTGGAGSENDFEYDYVRLECPGVAPLSPTPTRSATATPSATATSSASPTPSSTTSAVPSTPTATAEPSGTRSSTPSSSATLTASATATRSASPTPSSTTSAVPSTPTATAEPSGTASASPSSTASATPTQSPTAEPSPTFSATPTMDLVDSPTSTFSASPTLTVSPTASASPTSSFTASASPSPSATAEPSGTASSSCTPTPTGSAELTATSTSTPTPSAEPSASPSPQAAGQGRAVIDRVVPVPNPNPRMVDLHLLGALSQVQVKVWTVALVLVAQAQAGALQAGWQQVTLPGLAGLPSGAYFISVSGQQGAASAKAPAAARILILR
jgi:rhamnogalacturonan endolyase